MYKCKTLGNKSQGLSNLKFSGRLFVCESMSHENQQLPYKYQQLKSAWKIHVTWFFKGCVCYIFALLFLEPLPNKTMFFISLQKLFLFLRKSNFRIFDFQISWCHQIFFFFLIGIHSMQGWTATTRHGVTRKEAQKKLQDKENLFRKNLQLKDVC